MHFMIDYENTGGQGLKGAEYLVADDKVTIFYSQVCDKIEYGVLKKILDSECNLEICRLDRTGRNALGFYIASKTGGLFGRGCVGKIAIVSRDKGFKAVQEYWRGRTGNKGNIILNSTIGGCIRTANENNARTSLARVQLQQVSLEEEMKKHREEEKIRRIVEAEFQNTRYTEFLDEIQELLKNAKGKKELYINSLKTFGRKDGVEVYRKMKNSLEKRDKDAAFVYASFQEERSSCKRV